MNHAACVAKFERPPLPSFWFHRLATLLAGLAAFSMSAAEPATAAPTDVPDDFLFRNWQSDEGLPQDTVSSIVQTQDGFLWVATHRGLARFDGMKFTVFSPFEGTNYPEKLTATLTRLFEANDGTLLIAGDNGQLAAFGQGQFSLLRPASISGASYVFTGFLNSSSGSTILAQNNGQLWRWKEGKLTMLGTNNGAQTINGRSLCEDDRGHIYVVQNQGTLLWFADGKLEPVTLPKELARGTCNALARDASGRLWLGTSDGLAVLRAGQFERVTLPGISQPYAVSDLLAARDGGLWIQHAKVFQKFKDGQWAIAPVELRELASSICFLNEDRWGRLCVGSIGDGLFRIAGNGTVLRCDHRNGLPGDAVLCCFTDSEDDEWYGLQDAGLVRLRARRITSLFPATAPIGSAFSVCEDHQGAIWTCTSDAGVFRILGTNIQHFIPADQSRPWSILEDGRTNLWLGTSSGLAQFRDGHFVPVFGPEQKIREVSCLYEAASGSLWLGGAFGLSYVENGQLKYPQAPLELGGDFVRAIVEDGQSRIWVGTGYQGLFCLEGGQWKHFSQHDGLASDIVLCLFVDSEDTLWAGTFGGGLSRLHDGKFVNYNLHNGLADNFITHISEDRNGWFWLASWHRGVVRVTRQQLEAFAHGEIQKISSIVYDRSDGLPSAECNGAFQPSGWTTRDGRLLLPTLKGVVAMRPENIAPNTPPPKVFIDAVTIDDRAMAMPPATNVTIVAPPGTYRLKISYTALDFSDPDKLLFRYRLDDLSPSWIEAGSQRTAEYIDLRPGTFQFHVIARNSDAVWNTVGATLTVIVQPHFWQTTTFLLSALLLLILILLGGGWQVGRVRAQRKIERLQQQKAVERERVRIARDIHDELGANLTTITQLSELIQTSGNQPDQIKNYSDQILSSARSMVLELDETVWAINPHSDTLDSLIQYAVHYTNNFFEYTKIKCRFNLPTHVPPLELNAEIRHNLFLIIKEALNNVQKHSGASIVTLRLELESRGLELAIEDDGCGLTAQSRASNQPVRSGLNNMRSRAESIGAVLSIERLSDRGTRVGVRLVLPPAQSP